MTRAGLSNHVRACSNRAVLVVGDLMLDEFVRGDVLRISPEAPVPVLEVKDRSYCPGGAANAAANVRSLGGRAFVIGVVGADDQGERLRSLMSERGLDVSGVVVDPSRPTTHKVRISARGQQIVRIDGELRAPLSAAIMSALLEKVRGLAATADAVIISDYAKGVVTPELCQAVTAACAKGCPIVVDPKRKDLSAYRGATIVTPNLHELEVAAGDTCETDALVVEAGTRLLPDLGGADLLVTRGADGMTLIRPKGGPIHIAAKASSVFDVTGAGDAVVSTLALALAARTPIDAALELANQAAAIAVSRTGTVAVTAAELVDALDGA
jgi:rfaE bifunctional protein kinase chain/domain